MKQTIVAYHCFRQIPFVKNHCMSDDNFEKGITRAGVITNPQLIVL